MGGLGNQMFQYAAARAISEQKVFLDNSFLINNQKTTDIFTPRKYELNIFRKLNGRSINSYFMRFILSKNEMLIPLKQFIPAFFRKINFIHDDTINKTPKTDKKVLNYLDGYFQNPVIFEHIRNKLINEFQFPKLSERFIRIADAIKQEENSISIHVRRGDYLKPGINNLHGVLSMQYYEDAIKKMDREFTNPFYFIFSDDSEWCEKNFTFLKNRLVISQNNPPHVDMNLMSLCKHHIVANSSFSWWAAWLNNKASKVVIAPKIWFQGQETNIIPKDWISL